MILDVLCSLNSFQIYMNVPHNILQILLYKCIKIFNINLTYHLKTYKIKQWLNIMWVILGWTHSKTCCN